MSSNYLSIIYCPVAKKRFSVFYNVFDLRYYGLESGIFELEINVEDIRDRHWENCRYYVHDWEDEFALKCEDFDYEWI